MNRPIMRHISRAIRRGITKVASLSSRHFTTFDSVEQTYAVIGQPITFSDAFEIEAEFSSTDTNVTLIVGNSEAVGFRVLASPTMINVYVDGGSNVFAATPKDGRLHKVRVVIVGTSTTVYLDDVSLGTRTISNVTGAVPLNVGWSSGMSNYFNGTIANIKFTDNSGTLPTTTTFKIDSVAGNDVESSVEGNNTLTLHNRTKTTKYVDVDGVWVHNDIVTRAELETMISNDDDVTHVDTSTITSMDYLFDGYDTFNQDISGWDTSNVTDMGGMFYEATAFNQDISGWNTSNVTNMGEMFYYAESFNQPIGRWDVSKVTVMEEMFADASSFNQDLSSWVVSKVRDM